MQSNEPLNQLVNLSQTLAQPSMDMVILGEGNTSAKLSGETFAVKASGHSLKDITENGFVECRFKPVLSAIAENSGDNAAILELLKSTRVDASATAVPSVETFLHGYLLSLPNIQFAAHTHPTAVNAILCSVDWRVMEQPIFPDQLVCCGLSPVMIEYTDPGLELARKMKRKIEGYIRRFDSMPKLILMQNHGMIAIGKTVKEVVSISMMAVKTARVLLGAMSMGGINAFDPETASAIVKRPDEVIRRNIIEQT